MKQYILTLIYVLLLGVAVHAQEPKAQPGPFALVNATIETVTKGTVEGTLLIQDGKITAIGADVEVPADARVIDCEGMYLYPGLIDGGTQIGLFELGSGGLVLTRDYNEIGEVIPDAQALTAVNPNSVIIPVTRTNGVTTALTIPTGGLFSGTGALIDLHGYTPEQMYAGFKGVVMNFPSTARRGRYDRRSDEDIEKARKKRLQKLEDVWKKAEMYARLDSLHKAGKGTAPDYYPEMAALVPVLRKEMKLLIEVNRKEDIESAIKWVEEHEVDAVFMGVQEGWRVAEALAESKIPVITGPVLSTPTRSYDRYDRPYANAGLMHKAGVKVAIRTNERENVRNLPFNAGFAAAYGLGKEEALKAITINAAEILGVDDHLGSLEVGKQANVLVTSGDPMETATEIRHVFIDGYLMPNSSRHIRLYEEFLERDPGAGK